MKHTRASAIITALIAALALATPGCSKKSTPQPKTPPKETAKKTPKQPDAAKKPDTPSVPTSAAVSLKLASKPVKAPKRIILLIGDGMGAAAVTAASYAKGAPMEMLKMPHVALMRTHEHEFMTTDSAASATAFATGEKTHFEGVSVKPGTTKQQEEQPDHHFKTMVEAAKGAGWKTGLVATSRITHATPAAFAAHRAHRSSYEDIARDMSTSGVDVLLGAGAKYFNKRKDGKDLLADMKGAGYTIANSADAVRAAVKDAKTKKLVGLMHPKDMPSVLRGGRAMKLSDMLDQSLKVLDRDNPEGFFLMVEGSQIDWEEHNLNGVGTVAETVDFDEAVGIARKYASGRDDTLVVVTADHETGGLAVLDPPNIQRFEKILGGPEQAAAAVHGKKEPGEDPIQYVPLGTAKSDDPKAQLFRRGAAGLAPAQPVDPRVGLVFGYLSVASRPYWEGNGRSFISTHTATMVPLFAEGAGAETIAQVHDNAELGRTIQRFMAASKKPEVKFEAPKLDAKRPKNVILLIGDGMGVSTVTAAYYAAGHLSMLSMPVQGLVATHGHDRVVNDSAATATALATGKRARYYSVGVVPEGDKNVASESVLEAAEKRGMRTGIVTTTTLTHATPGSFYAHYPTRKREDKISEFFIDMPSRVKGSDGVDVAYAGGSAIFTTAQLDALKKRGVKVHTEWDDTPAPAGSQVLRLVSPRGLDRATRRHTDKNPKTPTLAKMTRSALETLGASEKGFFLMVEGGQIDWALHALEHGQDLINEVIDFDQAVAAALEYASKHEDTLVLVTADHDHTMSLLDNHYGFVKKQCGIAKRCGGPVVFEGIDVAPKIARGEGFHDTKLQGDFGKPQILMQYAWHVQAAAQIKQRSGPHSATFVPIFAYGPDAARYGGFHEQPQLGQFLLRWARGE